MQSYRLCILFAFGAYTLAVVLHHFSIYILECTDYAFVYKRDGLRTLWCAQEPMNRSAKAPPSLPILLLSYACVRIPPYFPSDSFRRYSCSLTYVCIILSYGLALRLFQTLSIAKDVLVIPGQTGGLCRSV